jgi:ATP-dependent RNA helicase DeaD
VNESEPTAAPVPLAALADPVAAPVAATLALTPVDPVVDGADDSDDDSGVRTVNTDYVSNRSFRDFPLSPEVVRGIEERGYTVATAVQAATLEPALAGRDLVVRSKTGTGKTAAFCIPVVERMEGGARKTLTIALTPTRELARQVGEEAAALATYKDLRVAVIYGGVGFGEQEEALKAGAEMVVGTPGRILDHIRRGNLDLSQVEFVILDEADEMLSMGFYEDVSKILDATPSTRQCLFFSATVDSRVRSLIKKYAREPEDMRLSTDTDKVDGIAHILYETSPDYHKARALLAILDQEQPGSAIIFCNTREDTATVASFLSRQGLDVELISGELPQKKREEVMAKVKKAETQFLVATDVASRGIDISDLTHVINYSLPEDPAVYLHRTGRTGRIGKKGTAISLAGGTDMSTRLTLERQYEIAFEMRPLPTAEDAARARVDRQAAAIRAAMGTMAFEGYISTVKVIKERADGDYLLAACLRAFFLWDRMRKVENDESAGSVDALHEARDEQSARRREEGGSGRPGGRRDDRGDRGDRGPRRDDRGPRRDDRGPAPRRERTERRPDVAPVAAVAPPPSDSGPAASGEAGEARKRRRRRRRSGEPATAGGESSTAAD